jgi:hypothetical protein
MSKEIFVAREFRAKTLAMIGQANAILIEYKQMVNDAYSRYCAGR